ncbi:MAG: MerR family transcriptional regulator, repressor of the yfmOP operon [Gaiellaceae bacterium]|nr:MerR family transcriptional regulator, repressor of the yfmOP operon [Gaiellaceae bacterium]
MTAQPDENAYRIGEVAERVGVTTRTIRYYEELGLLGCDTGRPKGAHRLYSDADVSRLQELIRLRDLLGLSLDELVELAEAENTRAGLRNQWDRGPNDAERLRIVQEATPLLERQLALVHARQKTLAQFAASLEERLGELQEKAAELSQDSAGAHR